MHSLSKQDFFTNDLDNDSFNLIYTDMPYKSFSNIDWDDIDIPKFWSETDRLTKDDAAWVLFCNDLLMKDLFQTVPDHIKFLYEIIWKKGHVRNFKSWSTPLKTKEHILFFEKGKFKPIFKDGTKKKPYKRTGFGNRQLMRNQDYMKNTKNPNEFSYGVYEDIWDIPYDPKNIRVHPTQKPMEIHYRIHKIFSHYEKEDNLKMLDPFMGSGSLLLPFKNATGMDINEYGDFDVLSNYYNDVFLKTKERQERQKRKGKALL